jgi:hypothetical protein
LLVRRKAAKMCSLRGFPLFFLLKTKKELDNPFKYMVESDKYLKGVS